jgi:ribosomal protein L44E
MVEKYTLMNCRAYTEKLIELVKAGKEIDMNLTNSMFGRFYTIVVKADGAEAKPTVAEKATNVVEEDTEAVEPQQAEAKSAARGRKAK